VSFASDDDAAAALRELIAAGMPVVEFAAAQGSLERTFLDLEAGAPPASADPASSDAPEGRA
jgi:ABC-2 type transport system ATP-binding protein